MRILLSPYSYSLLLVLPTPTRTRTRTRSSYSVVGFDGGASTSTAALVTSTSTSTRRSIVVGWKIETGIMTWAGGWLVKINRDRGQVEVMSKKVFAIVTLAAVFIGCFSDIGAAQDRANPRPRSVVDRPTRPVMRGLSYAVSSMRPESTQVAERILRAGGNAFDAAVAAQAVLALVDAPNNGVGSDAMMSGVRCSVANARIR